MEEAESPKPAALADAHRAAVHAHPLPEPEEGRSHEIPVAPLPARGARSARRKRQVKEPLPAFLSEAEDPREPAQALGVRSPPALPGPAPALVWADCL